MEFRSLKAEKLSDRVVNEILDMIKDGKLNPGDKLPPETEFAKQLGISRGILREALTLLQSHGYITRKPKDGTYIRSIIKKDKENESIMMLFKKATYMDLLELRESLEQKVVEDVIERASEQEILSLESMLLKPGIEDKINKMVDQDFHLKLAELSKNILIFNFMSIYYDLIHEMAENNFKSEKRRKEVINEHLDIIRAIKMRDVDEAKHAVVKHLKKVEEVIGSADIQQSIDGMEMQNVEK